MFFPISVKPPRVFLKSFFFNFYEAHKGYFLINCFTKHRSSHLFPISARPPCGIFNDIFSQTMEYHICLPKGGFIIFFYRLSNLTSFSPKFCEIAKWDFFLQTTEHHMFNANFCETQREVYIDFFTDHRTSHSFPISVRPPRQFFIKIITHHRTSHFPPISVSHP